MLIVAGGGSPRSDGHWSQGIEFHIYLNGQYAIYLNSPSSSTLIEGGPIDAIIKGDAFNRFAVEVTPTETRYYINDTLVSTLNGALSSGYVGIGVMGKPNHAQHQIWFDRIYLIDS